MENYWLKVDKNKKIKNQNEDGENYNAENNP
jgi:hypothetical protein